MSSAAALVSITDYSRLGRLNGGRAMERLWMAANAEGLSVHPISAAIFLTQVLPLNIKALREHERAELEHIREDFNSLWHLNGRHPLFLVRLTPGSEPSARSLRLDLQDLLLPTPITVG